MTEMKLAISNIAWDAVQDEAVYGLMKQYGFSGLEIAPTRIFPDAPYSKITEARQWSFDLKRRYGFTVPSIQSIWYGRKERLFGSAKERQELMEYTKKAIMFAAATECRNLVFGCPKNRTLPDGGDPEAAITFFREIGDFAYANGAVIGMEANPVIYGTNYITDTASAVALIQEVNSKGFRLNLDVGTMVENDESLGVLEGAAGLINHVHISEPNLNAVQERTLHHNLVDFLKKLHYSGFLSIEMGKTDNLECLEAAMAYVGGWK
jgi:sugar phosphate isomerase/epimerase